VWTLIGGLSIPHWATWPALSLQIRDTSPLDSHHWVRGWIARPGSPQIRIACSRFTTLVSILDPGIGFCGRRVSIADSFLWATHYIGARRVLNDYGVTTNITLGATVQRSLLSCGLVRVAPGRGGPPPRDREFDRRASRCPAEPRRVDLIVRGKVKNSIRIKHLRWASPASQDSGSERKNERVALK